MLLIGLPRSRRACLVRETNMGCVQSKCFGCYKQRCFCCCCSHYQSSSLSTDAAGEADDPFRAQETDPSNRLHALPIVGGAPVPSAGIRLRYASLTQRGYYPDSPDRANQDSFCVYTRFRANAELHFFGVFDGHGQFGAQCSEFARDKITDSLAADARLQEDPAKSCQSSFLAANLALHDSDIDDSMSGTTAITVLVVGSTLYVANVGDSRAVAGVWKGNCVVAEDLSSDQTPYRKDEYERVKLCGARVLSVDQVEGILDPDIQSWGAEEDCDGDPPRLWVQNGMYPGTAFTRSIGDSTAESIGVIAIPEIKTVKITPNHLFFVIASDGVFEFLSSQAVVEMVSMFPDPREACSAIVTESYKLWLEHENRTDDITVIVVHIKDMDDSDVVAAGETIQSNHNAVLSPEKVEIKRHVSSQSERTHPNKNSCRELPLCPLDCSTDKTLPCIAPSSTHAIRLNSINPG